MSRSLLPLINCRDILSLAHENLARAHASCLREISNTEVENIQSNRNNQDLARKLLELTRGNGDLWRQELNDATLKEQLDTLEKENKTKEAEYLRMKRIVSATIVASGVDWASDQKLCDLVVDDAEDST